MVLKIEKREAGRRPEFAQSLVYHEKTVGALAYATCTQLMYNIERHVPNMYAARKEENLTL